MSKERFEWIYNETMLKHYMVDNLNNQQLGYESIVNLLNQQDQRIAELEEQLKNAKKETAKKVIDRVEELSVFDFKAYEEHDLRKYTITELALDVILREYGENK